MSNRIPPDAFAYYVSLGLDRSYDRVAEKYEVTTRAVTKAAARENWTPRLAQIEAEAKAAMDKKLTDDLAEMGMRHRKLLRAIAGRAAKAISDYPLTDGMQGIRAAEIAIKLERVLAGEPSEHTAMTVASTTREEMQRFLKPAAETDDGEEW